MSDTVHVGCRIPNGVKIRVSDWIKDPDGNPMLREIAMYEIAGSSQHVGHAPGGLHPEGDDDAVAYTEIPADHWDKWVEQNGESDLAKSGALFKGDPKEAEQAEEEQPHTTETLPMEQPVEKHEDMSEAELERVTRP